MAALPLDAAVPPAPGPDFRLFHELGTDRARAWWARWLTWAEAVGWDRPKQSGHLQKHYLNLEYTTVDVRRPPAECFFSLSQRAAEWALNDVRSRVALLDLAQHIGDAPALAFVNAYTKRQFRYIRTAALDAPADALNILRLAIQDLYREHRDWARVAQDMHEIITYIEAKKKEGADS